MRITEVETLPVSVGGGYDYAVIIVLVRTDEGLTGIGEASLAGRGRGVLGILDHFGELLVGQDPAKIEHWDPQASIVQTIEVTESLRGAVGDDVDLILDAHTMFSPAEAAYLGHALEPCRLYFYEDPIRPLSPLSLRTVREKMNLPIATGEQLAHKWEFQPLIENELVDYLRIDLVHAGGITEAKKILAAGELHGQRSALHHASSPVNGTACVHVDMAVPNFGIQEWMELEPLYELFPNAPRAHAGYVSPSRGPGLGLDFDETEARKRPSRDARLPQRYWPDASVGDY